jgi:hypothetical protein
VLLFWGSDQIEKLKFVGDKKFAGNAKNKDEL